MPDVRRLPVQVAGWLRAGPDQHYDMADDHEHIYIEEDFAHGRDLLAFRVLGDSMAAGKTPIYSGDTVVVNCDDKGRDGASVVAHLNNDGYVCKLLKQDKFGANLISANPSFTNGTPPYIPGSDVAEIVGRVVRIIHDEGTEPA